MVKMDKVWALLATTEHCIHDVNKCYRYGILDSVGKYATDGQHLTTLAST